MSKIGQALNKAKWLFKGAPQDFLSQVSGVIHVGANVGQECELYNRYDLHVLWFEPIPEVFVKLVANISAFPKQRALQFLLTDKENDVYQFHVSSNDGASSSILEFKEHTEIWPDVSFVGSVELRSTTLSAVLASEKVDPSMYQALVLDTQGSELLVLRGSVTVLPNIEFIKVEVPDFESYKGCCLVVDVEKFMAAHGYVELSRHRFAGTRDGGSYFDIVYGRGK